MEGQFRRPPHVLESASLLFADWKYDKLVRLQRAVYLHSTIIHVRYSNVNTKHVDSTYRLKELSKGTQKHAQATSLMVYDNSQRYFMSFHDSIMPSSKF